MRFVKWVKAAHIQIFKDGMMDILAEAKDELTQQLTSRLRPDSGPELCVVLDRALDIFHTQKTEAQEQATRRAILGQKWVEPTKREFLNAEGPREHTY